MAGCARIHGPPPDMLIGKLFGWGDGFYGSLDNNLNSISRSSPIQIGSDTDWKLGYCGNASGAVFRTGRLFTFGLNSSGELGLGDRTNRSSPTQVGSANDWRVFSQVMGDTSESSHTGVIRGGALFMWGANNYGQLARSPSVLAYSSPVQVGSETDWSYVAVSGRASFGIRSGKLFAWGYNSSGQLGQGDTVNRSSPVQVGAGTDWTSVSCGYYGVHAIRGGRLFGWGDNSAGVIGDGTSSAVFTKSSPSQIGSATDWIYVSHGWFHALGLRQGGALFSWGFNNYGQLGHGGTTQRSSPVQVGALTNWTVIGAGEKFSAGIRDGKLYMWGYNGYGNLGLGDTNTYLSPVQVGSATDWRRVVVGATHVLGIRAP